MYSAKPSVLACVSNQYDCDRVIEAAKKLADKDNCDLRVLTVMRPEKDYTIISDQIEYLNLAAKEADADMTFVFSVNASQAAAQFANENNVTRIVTGLHDGVSERFLVGFNEMAPDVRVSVVDSDKTVYTMKSLKDRETF